MNPTEPIAIRRWNIVDYMLRYNSAMRLLLIGCHRTIYMNENISLEKFTVIDQTLKTAKVFHNQQTRFIWSHLSSELNSHNVDSVLYHIVQKFFDRKYFTDKKFKVKHFRGYMTSSKYFYLQHISLAIIHAH